MLLTSHHSSPKKPLAKIWKPLPSVKREKRCINADGDTYEAAAAPLARIGQGTSERVIPAARVVDRAATDSGGVPAICVIVFVLFAAFVGCMATWMAMRSH